MAQEFEPGPEQQRAFRDALGRFATGVTLVTTRSPLGPLGITANSFASLSIDPPLVLWSPARSSRRFPAFTECDHFAIHVLSEQQFDIAHRFVSDGLAFDGVDWEEGPDGTPLLAGALARFVCTRHAVHDGGDHAIVVGRVVEATSRDGDPLVFALGHYGGFSPEAPPV
jgi:flavin reductase (DIM6/NTAB) family NADH-FMN oxidoreductase RutF